VLANYTANRNTYTTYTTFYHLLDPGTGMDMGSALRAPVRWAIADYALAFTALQYVYNTLAYST
jgi:hypothetical protein